MGDINENFVEDENKVDIEITLVNLDCVKNEPSEEVLNFEEDSCAKQCTFKYENIFGEPSHQRKIKEDYDNSIDFLDNHVIMENAMIKLEENKEDDGSFNNFHCSKCNGIYKGYCLKCSSLLHILNNNSAFVNPESELNTIPIDILEIRRTSSGKRVYLLRTLPMNIIFGPFEGISGIESTVGHSWKIIDNKLMNIKSGNWMKNIVCAASASLKNLDIFQIDGNLYFQTNREIREGEELLIYYDNEDLQQLHNTEESLYTPQKQEKLPKIFACTLCCLGFGSSKCLIEHKRKCYGMENSRTMKDIILVECHYCKMWLEKWEHEVYHVAYCLKKHHRMWSDYSEAVDRSDTNIEEMEDDTKDDKRTYPRDICSRPYDGRDDSHFDTKDIQCFTGANSETRLSECALAERSNGEQIQDGVETHNQNHFENHLNIHSGIKPFKCDICMKKYNHKCNLKRHIRNKHTDDGDVKNYKCLECSYQTKNKSDLKKHLNKHKGIKPFTCGICMTKFTDKRSLNMHTKNKHADNESAKDYKCFDCSYETNHKTNFHEHLNKHRGVKAFKCDICMMKFTWRSNLREHIRNKHTTEVNAIDYKCSECCYQTNIKRSLQRHLNKHTCVKPFKCDICMAKFIEQGSLKTHIKYIHADDGNVKDYKCLECSFKTKYKNNFQKHLDTHTGIKQFQCDICMMKFSQKVALNKHIKNKHTNDGNVKDYKCSECSFQTNYRVISRSI